MTAIDLDEDLSLEESPWRGRIITAGVLLLVGAALTFLIKPPQPKPAA